MMRLVLFMGSLFWTTSVHAQSASPCSDQTPAEFIVEPWEENSRTFADGDLRVAVIDTSEPASGSFYVMVLHPPRDDFGVRSCTLIGRDAGIGYASIYFQDLDARYDPATGLILQVPAIIYLPEFGFQNTAYLFVAVNQQTGDITVKHHLVE